jgi:hypothetical protein
VKIIDQRADGFLAGAEAFGFAFPIDGAFEIKDYVDAFDGFERDGRDDNFPVARGAGDIGELEEVPARMRPAGGFKDRPGITRFLVKRVEPGIGVGLKCTGPFFEMALRMLAGAVGRVEIHCCWRIGAGKRFIVAHIDP